MNEDVFQMDEQELKRVCAFALCPPKQATASSFYNTVGGTMSQLEKWCDRHDAVLLIERTPRRDEDETEQKWWVRVCLDGDAAHRRLDYSDSGPDLHIALMRASIIAARAVEEKKS